jgi:hypothetical protein
LEYLYPTDQFGMVSNCLININSFDFGVRWSLSNLE